MMGGMGGSFVGFVLALAVLGAIVTNAYTVGGDGNDVTGDGSPTAPFGSLFGCFFCSGGRRYHVVM